MVIKKATVTQLTITLAYQRGMQYNTLLNKACGPISGYVGMMEHSVYNTLKPLAAVLSTWQDSPVKNDTKMGWPEMSNFEGLDIVHPSDLPGLTTGDCFMLRREDVRLTTHRELEIEQVPSGRDSAMFVIRIGINMHVVNPGFQGKMTDKD